MVVSASNHFLKMVFKQAGAGQRGLHGCETYPAEILLSHMASISSSTFNGVQA
jgi:hypothetical protein